jgi:DNA-binding NarL/FixJ family response regulator
MDIRMPRLDGLAATRELMRRIPACRVLILTTYDPDEYVYEALRSGASGFLLKDAPPEQLLEAVRVIARGDALLAPSITRRLIAEFASTPFPDHGHQLDELTPREREILTHIARGLPNAEIAKELFVGDDTMKAHVAEIAECNSPGLLPRLPRRSVKNRIMTRHIFET